MKFLKRAAAAVTAFSLVFSSLMSFPASAAVDSNVYTAAGLSDKKIQFADTIRQMIAEWDESEIDISSYGLSYDEVVELYGLVIFNEPEFYYVSPVNLILGYRNKSKVITFQLDYIYSKSEVKKIQKKLDSYSNELLNGVRSEWSDTEKVLYVHDYLCRDLKYYDGTSVFKGRNIYDAFDRGTAVCVGYSLSFQYIMDKLGIPCINVTSANHMWSMVQIDSKWYHLDLTWDDSADFTDSFNTHNSMLMSRDRLLNLDVEHEEPDYELPAKSKKYDDFFWNDALTTITYSDGYWYYTTEKGLYKYSFDTEKSTLIYKFTEKWPADEEYVWTISFSTPVEINGVIYFNDKDTVYSYSPKTGKVSVECTPVLNRDNEIYDLKKDGDRLLICAGSTAYSPNEQILAFSPKAASSSSASKVTDLTLTRSGNTLTLKWKNNASAKSYIIYRKSGNKIYKIGTTDKNSFSFKYKSSYSDSSFAVKVQTANGKGEYSQWVKL